MSAGAPTMRGRRVLITGGAGALGRAHALDLGRAGCTVVVSDVLDPGPVVAELREQGVAAHGVRGGVETWEAGAEQVAAALDLMGGLDVVVNNAGFLRDKGFSRMTPQMADEVLAVHLHGAFHVTSAAWPHLGPGSSVVMTTSGSGLYGNPGQANYAAAKAGLVGLMRTLALEGRRRGVRVNAIAPVASSPLTQEFLAPDEAQRLDPEWVAPLVTWLADPRCTATGHTYVAGGGHFARVATLEGRGVQFTEPPSAADLAHRFAQVDDLSDAVEPADLAGHLAAVLGEWPPHQG